MLIFRLIILLAIINGIFSPYLYHLRDRLEQTIPLWSHLPINIQFFMASLLLASFSLMASGVPSGLYERLSRNAKGWLRDGLWLVLLLLISFPALLRIWLVL